MATETRTAVVVVTWNSRRYIDGCLNGLARQTLAPAEVIVVDNASTDGTADYVAERFPVVRLIRSSTNLGFAAGCNLGIRRADAEYVATLNPDTVLDPRWLELLANAMESAPDLGMCASLMVFMDRSGMVNSAGICVDVLGIAWDRLGGRPVAEAGEPVDVFGPCAGAALYRTAMLKDLGGFAEEFFMYLEDVDLAWRAQAQGWRCLYVPEAVVLHAHSASAGEGSSFKNYLKARNKVWLIARNYPWPQIAKWGIPILLFDMGAVLLTLAGGDLAPLRGRLDAVRNLKGAMGSRKNQPSNRQGWQVVRSHMVGVASPFAIKRRFAHLNAVNAGDGGTA